MDVSVIDELPPGRKPIQTSCLPLSGKEKLIEIAYCFSFIAAVFCSYTKATGGEGKTKLEVEGIGR